MRLAAAAGVTILAVTDHDTVSGCEPARAACTEAGIAFVAGIEITAIRADTDVHVLGYFIDVESAALVGFLAEQRHRRIDRVRRMVDKLASLGIRLDAEAIVRPALDDPKKSAGRPWIARALVTAGHVATSDDAFDRWLERGKPAFVPRLGASPEEVFERIHRAGGLVSLAHPALVGRDEWIDEFAAAGLDALEVYHSEHDRTTTARYLDLASRLGIGVTGGSDFHGDRSHGPAAPGAVSLPGDHYDRLLRLKRRTAADASCKSLGLPPDGA